MASEITVAGGGIFGLACAWELTRRGQKVRLFEAERIGSGTSGGHVGALAPHSPENWNAKKQVQLDALIAAADWWAGPIPVISGLAACNPSPRGPRPAWPSVSRQPGRTGPIGQGWS